MKDMNGIKIIGVDHGYGNIKTANCCFPTGIAGYDAEPLFTADMLVYEDRYYLIGEGYKEFLAEKTMDDDYYLLTLVAVARELALEELTEASVFLAVGLPLTWTASQKAEFAAYLSRKEEVSFTYRKTDYRIRIAGVKVYPQGYAAVAQLKSQMKGVCLVADIGNGTMNVLYIVNGRPQTARMYTEKFGTYQCTLAAREDFMRRTRRELNDAIIDEVLRTGTADILEEDLSIIRASAAEYVEGIFRRLREHGYDENTMTLYVTGGGGCLIRHFGRINTERVRFVDDICAAANQSKTALVVISLALAVVLLNILVEFVLVEFVGGFDLEKYLSAQSCADFIVSSPDYFRSNIGAEEYLSEELVAELNSQTEASLAGFGYQNSRISAAWMSKSAWLMDNSHYYGVEQAEQMFVNQDHRDDTALQIITIEGLDDALLDKLILLDGDLAPLHDPDGHSIAISAVLDDYGNLEHPEYYPAIGDTLTVVYGNNMPYVDSRSGEWIDENTPVEYMKMTAPDSHEVDYTVCALVAVPHSMSFRYRTVGYEAVLPVEALERDSGARAIPLFYLFDAPDEEAETEAERVLSEMTSDPLSALMYESKATVRADFEGFRKLFLLLGGALCAIIELVGICIRFS